jgi:hypothetical protein
MEEHAQDTTTGPGFSRLWLVLAVGFVAAAVWAGMALAALSNSSAPASAPALAQSMSPGYVVSKGAPSIASKSTQANCPNMGGSSGSSNGSTTTPGL